MHVFNDRKLDYKQEPLVFGSELNIQEYADPKYPIIEKANNQMIGLFWRPEEVSLMKDRSDFQRMTPGEQFIFVSNLQYQILLDSVQGRGPLRTLLPIVSNPEFEAAIITWGFFETIHSRSYTHIIRNLFDDPNVVLRKVLDVPEIVQRAKTVTKYYDRLGTMVDKYSAGLLDDDNGNLLPHHKRELMKLFYLTLVAINILEGVRFYVSFVCNFAFGENKLMEGTTKIMSLIARDEAQHLALSQNIINLLRKGSEGQEWVDVIAECEEEAMAMYKAGGEQEKEWGTFLFSHGQMRGLNAKLIHQYIEDLVNKRCKGIGLKPVYGSSKNPFGWLDSWLNSKSVQPAPQETEIESYLIGQINADVDALADLGDMSL